MQQHRGVLEVAGGGDNLAVGGGFNVESPPRRRALEAGHDAAGARPTLLQISLHLAGRKPRLQLGLAGCRRQEQCGAGGCRHA